MAEQQQEAPQADQYDLGNTELDLSQPDGLPVETPAATPPRDPATGRFVKPADTIPVSPEHQLSEPPVKPAHPSYLIAQALELGFDQDDVDAMPTEALGRAVHRVFREREQQRDFLSKQAIFRDNQVQRPVPEPVPEEPLDLGFDPESSGIAPEIVGAFRKLDSEQKKLIKELQSRVAQGEQREQARALSEQEQMIDRAFEKLGPTYKSVFGDGSLRELGVDSPEGIRRKAVVQTAAQMKEGTFAQKLARAAKALFGDGKSAPPEENAYNGKTPRVTPEQWAAGVVERPTQRRGAPEPKGDQLAVRNLERKIREAEGAAAQADSEILDGLLGK